MSSNGGYVPAIGASLPNALDTSLGPLLGLRLRRGNVHGGEPSCPSSRALILDSQVAARTEREEYDTSFTLLSVCRRGLECSPETLGKQSHVLRHLTNRSMRGNSEQ